MGAPTYNETYAGIPIPDAILDAYLRAVAIAIQGLMNRSPKRPLTERVLAESVEPMMWSYGREPFFRLDLKGDKSPIYTWRPDVIEPARYYWTLHVHENFDAVRTRPMQKEVEEGISLFFTRPYPVQHVSNEAVARARTIAIKAMRRAERGR